jgi:uncharacterized protein YcfJ
MICVAAVLLAGCATKGETGLLAGSGIGALMGQLIGRNTTSTLIGTGVGAGLGYIIGNEMDKSEAKKREKATSQETQTLAGTTWKVVSVNPQPKKPFKSMIIRFRDDGTVVTTKTDANGIMTKDTEKYRIVGSTLVINDPDYVINARYKIDGDQMIMDTPDTSFVLKRTET